eukprot:s170_g1.t1
MPRQEHSLNPKSPPLCFVWLVVNLKWPPSLFWLKQRRQRDSCQVSMCYSSETRSRRRAKTTPASILKGGRFLYADFDHIETPPITRPRVRFNAVVTISAIPARHAEEFAVTPRWQASKSRF